MSNKLSMRFGGIEMPVCQGFAKDGRHITCAPFVVSGVLDDGRVFEIGVDVGFIFDGASIPRALWRLCGHPMSVPRVAAALAHDWLYSAHVCTREEADLIYRTICRKVGISGFVAGIEYYTLRIFGKKAWESHGEDDEKSALEIGVIEIEGEVLGGGMKR